MSERKLERYVRWQDYRINQLSFSINLFLSFSVASLAYAINSFLEPNVPNGALFKLVIEMWSYSCISGVAATIFRLLDFRYTVRKIRKANCFNRFFSRHLGKFTWAAFWGQIIYYSVGAYMFIYGMVYNFGIYT
ncbi:hypothetical protein A6E10_19400 [Aliivibrio fischeri]|nr:hypothetical protein A6E10_19400 [Aliivibrio fischeri]